MATGGRRTRLDTDRLDLVVNLALAPLGLVSFFADTLRQRVIGLCLVLSVGAMFWLGRRLHREGLLTRPMAVLSILAVVAAVLGLGLAATAPGPPAKVDTRPSYQSTMDAARPNGGRPLEWSPRVSAETGGTIHWLLSLENDGGTALEHVLARAELPQDYLKVLEGSVRWGYLGSDGSSHELEQEQGEALFDGGIDLGSLAPGSGTYLRFITVVASPLPACEQLVRVKGFMSGDGVQERESPAEASLTDPTVCEAASASSG